MCQIGQTNVKNLVANLSDHFGICIKRLIIFLMEEERLLYIKHPRIKENRESVPYRDDFSGCEKKSARFAQIIRGRIHIKNCPTEFRIKRLRRYTENRKGPGSNPTYCEILANFFDIVVLVNIHFK